MKFLRNALAATAALITLGTNDATAVIDNPVTKAVIAVYNRELAANPTDYLIWFKLANEYYRHNEYVHALDDVNKALTYAPAGDKDLRFQAYMLRAGIYNQLEKHDLALADLNSAISLDATSYAAVYQRANTEFELGDYTAARADYTKLQRFNTRSIEALLGLARCSVKENNLSAANDYLEQAVNLDPNNAEMYVRRASVRKLMGDHNGAVEDLIVAISLDSNDTKAIQNLVDYGNTHYPATIAGLSNAVQLAPQNGLYRYLRGSIAQAHYNYLAAIDDLKTIIDQRLYNYHGLHASIARCEYSLGNYDNALAEIDTALGETTNVADYYVVRSQILRALNRHEDAINTAAKALAVDSDYVPGLIEMALNYIDKKEYGQAASLLGEASMIDTNDPAIYMLRAWLHETYLNQPVAAQQFYQQALEIEGYKEDDIRSLKGFALLALGQTVEADNWMDNILRTTVDHDGLTNYYASCYYILRDNKAKALECVEKSLQAGYSDNHNWMVNKDGYINTAAMRDDLQYINLLQKYNSIFGKK